MKRLKLIFLGLLFAFGVFNSYSQEISFTASCPSVIGVGEQFRIQFSVNSQNVSKLIAPTTNGFDVLAGPQTSRTSSYNNINGKVTNSSTTTFTYILSAKKEGSYNIGGAKIDVDGKTYSSNSLTIKVQKNPTQAQRSQMQGGYSQNQTYSQAQVAKFDEKSLFIKAFANKSKLVVGEELIITYKLYTLVPVSEFQVNKMPLNKGFWIEELDLSKDPVVTTEIIDGKRYQVATLRKAIAYPQEAGNLIIPPLDIDVVAHIAVRNQRRVSTGDPFFDSFFNDPFFQNAGQMGYERVKKNLKSNKISLNVEPLPKTEKEFSGAVGSFQISATANPLACKTNEAITLRYTISGNGNLSLLDKINLKLSEDFEAYDPIIEDQINKTPNGVSGKRTFEYIIIPRIQGEYKVPKVEFTYFDILKKEYKTISSPEFNLKIAKGKDELSGLAQRMSEREKYLKRDIEHINTKQTKFISHKDLNYYSPLLLILIIIIPLLSLIYIIYRNKTIKKNSDIVYVKYKKATLIALKRLKNAKTYLQKQEKDAFYTEIAQAIWNYLSDRFKIVKMDLSFENIKEILKNRNIKEKTINNLILLLNNCEYVRFSQGEEIAKMDSLYEEAINALSDIESQIK